MHLKNFLYGNVPDFIMDREQAVGVLKQIFEQCRFIEGKSIKLLPPKEGNGLSNTFQIHIQIQTNEILPSCVTAIVKQHDLAVKQKDSLLIIYKPYPNANQ